MDPTTNHQVSSEETFALKINAQVSFENENSLEEIMDQKSCFNNETPRKVFAELKKLCEDECLNPVYAKAFTTYPIRLSADRFVCITKIRLFCLRYGNLSYHCPILMYLINDTLTGKLTSKNIYIFLCEILVRFMSLEQLQNDYDDVLKSITSLIDLCAKQARDNWDPKHGTTLESELARHMRQSKRVLHSDKFKVLVAGDSSNSIYNSGIFLLRPILDQMWALFTNEQNLGVFKEVLVVFLGSNDHEVREMLLLSTVYVFTLHLQRPDTESKRTRQQVDALHQPWVKRVSSYSKFHNMISCLNSVEIFQQDADKEIQIKFLRAHKQMQIMFEKYLSNVLTRQRSKVENDFTTLQMKEAYDKKFFTRIREFREHIFKKLQNVLEEMSKTTTINVGKMLDCLGSPTFILREIIDFFCFSKGDMEQNPSIVPSSEAYKYLVDEFTKCNLPSIMPENSETNDETPASLEGFWLQYREVTESVTLMIKRTETQHVNLINKLKMSLEKRVNSPHSDTTPHVESFRKRIEGILNAVLFIEKECIEWYSYGHLEYLVHRHKLLNTALDGAKKKKIDHYSKCHANFKQATNPNVNGRRDLLQELLEFKKLVEKNLDGSDDDLEKQQHEQILDRCVKLCRKFVRIVNFCPKPIENVLKMRTNQSEHEDSMDIAEDNECASVDNIGDGENDTRSPEGNNGSIDPKFYPINEEERRQELEGISKQAAAYADKQTKEGTPAFTDEQEMAILSAVMPVAVVRDKMTLANALKMRHFRYHCLQGGESDERDLLSIIGEQGNISSFSEMDFEDLDKVKEDVIEGLNPVVGEKSNYYLKDGGDIEMNGVAWRSFFYYFISARGLVLSNGSVNVAIAAIRYFLRFFGYNIIVKSTQMTLTAMNYYESIEDLLKAIYNDGALQKTIRLSEILRLTDVSVSDDLKCNASSMIKRVNTYYSIQCGDKDELKRAKSTQSSYSCILGKVFGAVRDLTLLEFTNIMEFIHYEFDYPLLYREMVDVVYTCASGEQDRVNVVTTYLAYKNFDTAFKYCMSNEHVRPFIWDVADNYRFLLHQAVDRQRFIEHFFTSNKLKNEWLEKYLDEKEKRKIRSAKRKRKDAVDKTRDTSKHKKRKLSSRSTSVNKDDEDEADDSGDNSEDSETDVREGLNNFPKRKRTESTDSSRISVGMDHTDELEQVSKKNVSTRPTGKGVIGRMIQQVKTHKSTTTNTSPHVSEKTTGKDNEVLNMHHVDSNVALNEGTRGNENEKEDEHVTLNSDTLNPVFPVKKMLKF